FSPKRKYSQNDLPNHLRVQLENKKKADIPIITIWFVPEPSEREKLRELVTDVDAVEEFKITKYYDEHYSYSTIKADGSEANLEFIAPNVSPQINDLKNTAEALRSKLGAHSARQAAFAPHLAQAISHIDTFVK